MRVSESLTPIAGTEVVSRYLVRVWVPGSGKFEGWRTANWWLDEVDTAEDAIRWAREHSEGSPAEVLLLDSSGALLRIWGDEPVDSYTIVNIDLTCD